MKRGYWIALVIIIGILLLAFMSFRGLNIETALGNSQKQELDREELLPQGNKIINIEDLSEENLEEISEFISEVPGIGDNEEISLEIGDDTLGIDITDGEVVIFLGEIKDKTYTITTDKKTIDEIINSKDPKNEAIKAIKDGKIKIKGHTIGRKVKAFFAKAALFFYDTEEESEVEEIEEELDEPSCISTDPDLNSGSIAEQESVYERGTSSGTLSGEYGEYEDYCTNEERIAEYYCLENGNVGLVYYDCTYGCFEGSCRENSCISTDSNDIDGEAIYERGTTSGIVGSSTLSDEIGVYRTGDYAELIDQCSGNSDYPDRLIEYYCLNQAQYGEERLVIGYRNCEFGCFEGACLETSCSSTDPDPVEGIPSLYEAGNTITRNGGASTQTNINGEFIETGELGEFGDKCVDGDRLAEYFCLSTGSLGLVYSNCEFGCFEGACLEG